MGGVCDSPAQKLRCMHCRTLSLRRSRSTLKGVHSLAARRNLNYGFVKTMSNSRQNPVLALLFLQTPARSKNGFNACALFEWREFTLSAHIFTTLSS
jgi:hypothetical protein